MKANALSRYIFCNLKTLNFILTDMKEKIGNLKDIQHLFENISIL